MGTDNVRRRCRRLYRHNPDLFSRRKWAGQGDRITLVIRALNQLYGSVNRPAIPIRIRGQCKRCLRRAYQHDIIQSRAPGATVRPRKPIRENGICVFERFRTRAEAQSALVGLGNPLFDLSLPFYGRLGCVFFMRPMSFFSASALFMALLLVSLAESTKVPASVTLAAPEADEPFLHSLRQSGTCDIKAELYGGGDLCLRAWPPGPPERTNPLNIARLCEDIAGLRGSCEWRGLSPGVFELDDPCEPSALRDAPPTSAPSMLGWLISESMLSAVTLSPYITRTPLRHDCRTSRR